MKKVLLAFAITAFAASYTTNSFSQDGKKEVKKETKKCGKDKKCCDKKKSKKKK